MDFNLLKMEKYNLFRELTMLFPTDGYGKWDGKGMECPMCQVEHGACRTKCKLGSSPDNKCNRAVVLLSFLLLFFQKNKEDGTMAVPLDGWPCMLCELLDAVFTKLTFCQSNDRTLFTTVFTDTAAITKLHQVVERLVGFANQKNLPLMKQEELSSFINENRKLRSNRKTFRVDFPITAWKNLQKLLFLQASAVQDALTDETVKQRLNEASDVFNTWMDRKVKKEKELNSSPGGGGDGASPPCGGYGASSSCGGGGDGA